MSEHHTIGCPHCPHELRVRSEYLGRKVRCKYCGRTFVALAGPPPGAGQAIAPAGPAEPERLLDRLGDEPVADHCGGQGPPSEREEAGARAALAYEALAADRDRLAREIETLRAVPARDDDERSRLGSERDDALAELERLRQENRSLKDGLASAHDVVLQTDRDLASLREESRRLEQERGILDAEVLRLRQDLDVQGREQGERRDRERVEQGAELDRLRTLLEESRREGDELRRRLEAEAGERASIRRSQEARALAERDASAELRATIERLTAERDHLLQDRSDLARSRAEADERVAALRDDAERTRRDHEQRLEQSEQSLNSLRQACADLARAREEADREADSQRREAEGARTRADALADEHTRQVKALRAEVRRREGASAPGAVLRPRPELGPDHDPHASKADLELWLDEAQEALDEMSLRVEALGSEVQAARGELEIVNMDLALSEWGEPEIAFPFEEN